MISKDLHLQIYGLAFPGMPRGRKGFINSPDLAACVQPYPTKISFWRVEALFTGILSSKYNVWCTM